MIFTTAKQDFHTKVLSDVAFALTATDYKDPPTILMGGSEMDAAVRRLTPLECERLQGFPDGWTLIGEQAEDETWKDSDGNEYPVEVYKYKTSEGKLKKVSDAERYRALGNSIALPFWFYLLRRISAQYERPATLGSLFAGIGGFDLCWEQCNGKGSVLWTSEIDEFCNAVLRERFPEGESDG